MIPNITSGGDFNGLVQYLVENRDHEVIDLQGVSSVALAADEMAAVAALSRRASVKLIHLSFSAALEDGMLSADRWLAIANRMEHAFGMQGHQRVVVRHRDKTHDHIHVFWCTISIETGRTPPKQWFLKKGFAIDDVGPHSLTAEQVTRVPIDQRARHTYDFILLRRAQDLCRRLEREFGLRELRSPREVAKARVAGETRPLVVGQTKRAERTGSTPLIENADAIRAALEEADWPSKRSALRAIGLDLEPVYRTTVRGEELRGVVIVDLADTGNRMKASQLDTPDKKFGWRKLDERRASGTQSLEAWWPERESVPLASLSSAKQRIDQHKDEFDRLVQRHRLVEADKQAKRHALRARQKREIGRLRVSLMRQRAAQASELEPKMRREFYAGFHASVRQPQVDELLQRHLFQRMELVRTRKPFWIEFLKTCVDAKVVGTPALDNQMTGSWGSSFASSSEIANRRVQSPLLKRVEPARPAGLPVVRVGEPAEPDVETPYDGLSPALAAAAAARLRRDGR